MYKGYKGKFRVKNLQKYQGDASNITYRSLLERSFMCYLDTNPNILEWSSEEKIITYISPLDNRIHRYFPDFWIKFINTDNEIVESIIEIKPAKQTVAPKPNKTKRRNARYIREVSTWLVNNAKWEAARAWSEQRGMTFKIITDTDIKKRYKYKG